ncbi:recombinase family protein [Phaeacidiphilus oryzae]|uniref:recombinase family protein n=1 Tax=Phaeacidiphilus oryzae TaxID=348818 RepID=UPI0013773FE6|nr:recombinase family protein [Phaeacidiphilus oryzae]
MPHRDHGLGPRESTVAIYLRVSSAKQLRGYGLDVQLDECRAWLDFRVGKGKYTAEVYTDGGVSGKLANRPGLDQLNQDVAAGRIGLVVFGKLDRIGRTMKHIHRWVYDTTDLGVRIATADGRIDSDDEMFGIQLSLLAYMAELEHAMILDRTVGGREKKLAAGGWPGGVAPFWLKLPPPGVVAVPTLRPEKVKLLETAARLIVDEHHNGEQAARALNALEMTTARGLPWCGATLIRTFRETALDGYIIYRNTERVHGTTLRRDAEGNPLYGETTHIPVPMPLPAERVAQVRRALDQRSFRTTRLKQYILSGRMQSPCGCKYVGNHRAERDRTTYRCTGRRSTPPCKCREILAAPMERLVWSEVSPIIGDAKHLAALAAEWLGSVPERAQAYRERIAELDAQIERSRNTRKRKLMGLAAAFSAAADSAEDGTDEDIQRAITEMRLELREKERKLVAMREDTAARLGDAEAQETRAKEILGLISKAAPRLADLAYEQKCELLDLLDVRIQITSDHSGQLRPAGCPFEEWFRSRDALVPPPLSDEQWRRVEGCFPAPRKARGVIQPRVAFEASLMKVRDGLQWTDLPTSFGRQLSVYQRALTYFHDGEWEQAVRALGDCGGTPVPRRYVLPGFKITGSFDMRLRRESTNTCEGPGQHVSSSSPRTPGSSSPTTGRSCGRCSGPPGTAGW